MQLCEQGLVELDASASDCLRVCASGAAGCLQARLTGLRDAPRAGAPQTITDEQVALAAAETLTERGPGQDSHWSTRSIAAATRPGIRTARWRIGRGGSLAQGLARLVRPRRCAGPRSPVVPAIGPSPCPSADAMVGTGGTAVTVVACCLAWREQDVTGRRR